MTLTLVGNAEKILRSELRYCPELAWEEGDDDDDADDGCGGDYVSVNDFREAFKNYLADFFRQGGGGGTPPFR